MHVTLMRCRQMPLWRHHKLVWQSQGSCRALSLRQQLSSVICLALVQEQASVSPSHYSTEDHSSAVSVVLECATNPAATPGAHV